MEKIGRLARNAFHFLGSQGLNLVMGLSASVVMARTLGPEELGIFHQVQWFAGLVSVVVSLGFITSVTRFTAQYLARGDRESMLALVRFVFRFELGIALVSSLFLLLFAAPIADHYFSPKEAPLFAIAFLALTPGMQTAVFSALLEGAQVFRYQSLQAFTITPASLLLKIGLLLTGHGIEALLWSNLLFACVNLLFFTWAARREGLLQGWFRRPRPAADGDAPASPPPWKKEFWSYNRSVLGIHFIDIVVWARSENYFLGVYCPAVQIAYYNLAQNLSARVFGFLPSLLWKMLLPLASEQEGRKDRAGSERLYTLSLRYAGALVLPLFAFSMVAAYELVVIFFGARYAEVKDCFRLLILSAAFSTLAQPGAALLYARNRQGFALRFGAGLAVLNLGLNFWLIPRQGALGASASYALCTSLGVLGGFAFTRLRMGLVIPWTSLAKAALGSLLSGALAFLLLQWNHPVFGLFRPAQDLLEAWTGRRLEFLFGYRTLRVTAAFLLSSLLYAAFLLLVAKPNALDLALWARMRGRFPILGRARRFPLLAVLAPGWRLREGIARNAGASTLSRPEAGRSGPEAE